MSTGEIIIILFVYLMFFGAKGIPTLAQTLGKAVYQFRNATKDVQDEIMKGANDIRKQSNLRLDQIDLEDVPPAARPHTAETDEAKPVPPAQEEKNA